MVRPLLDVTRAASWGAPQRPWGLNAAPSCSLIRLAASGRTGDEGLADVGGVDGGHGPGEADRGGAAGGVTKASTFLATRAL
jgi:hypothetical protein